MLLLRWQVAAVPSTAEAEADPEVEPMAEERCSSPERERRPENSSCEVTPEMTARVITYEDSPTSIMSDASAPRLLSAHFDKESRAYAPPPRTTTRATCLHLPSTHPSTTRTHHPPPVSPRTQNLEAALV